MKNPKWILFSLSLALMAAAAVLLVELRAHPRLGRPGIKAEPIPGSVVMKIGLPEHVLDFNSTNLPESDVELGYFPKDTSYARRGYWKENSPGITATVLMMGGDRTSIHKPDYCLPGQGWHVEQRMIETIPLTGAGYNLPVSKWIASRSVRQPDGQAREIHGVYVFWFVADNEETPSHYERLWWLTRDLLRTGVLQRWAYVSYFAICEPGQEEATYNQMKTLIAASVPEFQQLPGSGR